MNASHWMLPSFLDIASVEALGLSSQTREAWRQPCLHLRLCKLGVVFQTMKSKPVLFVPHKACTCLWSTRDTCYYSLVM